MPALYLVNIHRGCDNEKGFLAVNEIIHHKILRKKGGCGTLKGSF